MLIQPGAALGISKQVDHRKVHTLDRTTFALCVELSQRFLLLLRSLQAIDPPPINAHHSALYESGIVRREIRNSGGDVFRFTDKVRINVFRPRFHIWVLLQHGRVHRTRQDRIYTNSFRFAFERGRACEGEERRFGRRI